MTVSPCTRLAVRVAILGGSAALLVGFGPDLLAAHASSPESPSLESPIDPLRAVALFDRPDTPYGPGHRGIDLDASVGDEVRSPGAGVVTFAGLVVDRGVITVTHPNGLVSSLEPITAGVEVGDAVTAGTTLGVVSAERSHCAPDTCLHWGVRRAGRYLNPLDVLVGFGPVRLLPFAGARPESAERAGGQ